MKRALTALVFALLSATPGGARLAGAAERAVADAAAATGGAAAGVDRDAGERSVAVLRQLLLANRMRGT
jgi:hypothetical protein